ncbi:spore coat protein CotJB [uncultured Ruminococcus sp.]|uniref:spore coat protein CotJB n=1 Tax=uncultured Ruminococcus sp. TaxID=165186 RepID=UPI0025E49967|nr:spore coat protein CotJB [uncultured Ruminococcus sp.]
MPVLNDKQKLLRRLQQSCFALAEANLYLDSHPTCQMGLEYFRKHKAEKDAIEKEYTEKYGHLTAVQSEGTKKWEWVQHPFPWERGEN